MVEPDPGPKVAFELRLNVVSLVNTAILLSLLVTAGTSLYTFISRVDAMQAAISQIKTDLRSGLEERKLEIKALQAQDAAVQGQIFSIQTNVSSRLSTVETEIRAIHNSLQRVEKALDRRP